MHDLVPVPLSSSPAPTPETRAPALIAASGEQAERRFWEFFTVTIRNPNTRRAYARAAAEFCAFLYDGGSGEADLQALLAGCQSKAEGDMRLAGTTWPEGDHVLTLVDELTASQLHREDLVQRWNGLEVEAIEALGRRELCSLNPAFYLLAGRRCLHR